MRSARAVLAVVALASTVVACSSDGPPPVAEPLPSVAPRGEWLCDQVPLASAIVVLGSARLEPIGQLRDYPDQVAGECVVENDRREGSEIMVQIRRTEERTLADVTEEAARTDVRHRYPAEVGAPAFVLGNEVKAYGVIVRNDYIVKVSISLPAEGRDAVADAVALTQQVADGVRFVNGR